MHLGICKTHLQIPVHFFNLAIVIANSFMSSDFEQPSVPPRGGPASQPPQPPHSPQAPRDRQSLLWVLLTVLISISLLAAWRWLQPPHTPHWLDVLLQAIILGAAMAVLWLVSRQQAHSVYSKHHQDWHLLPTSFDILGRQLHTGTSHSETAVMASIERMTHIQMINTALHQQASQSLMRTSAITQEMQQLSVKSNEALHSFLSQQQRLAALQAKKDEGVRQAMEDITKLIGPLVDVIHNIAKQTQLLSFNAAIEAARAGPEGSGFKIVAMAVRELAQQTSDAAKKIEDGIQTIQKAASLNSISYSQEIADTLQSMHTMHQLLELNMQHSNQLLPFLMELSRSMDQGTAEIRDHVLEVLGHMQFQDILKQILEQVKTSLSALKDYSSATIHGEKVNAQLSEIFQKWEESYVLLEQRLTHARATKGQPTPEEADAGPKIELF